ncbi:unnamed protein product [Caenorhabditis brenneri]
MKRILWGVYGFSISYSLISFVASAYDFSVHTENSIRANFEPIYIVPYFLVNAILFTAALTYIPVFFSVQKLMLLKSDRDSHPQNYIFWQFMTVIILKTISIPLIYSCALQIADKDEIGYKSSIWLCIVVASKFVDGLSTPFIIQITYLSCNKRNMELLLTTLKTRKMWKVVCCPCFQTSSVNVPSTILAV